MKKNLTLVAVVICTIALNQNASAQWLVGGNPLPAAGSNDLGTTAGAVAPNKALDIITNGVPRIALPGTSFGAAFLGPSGLGINTNFATIADINASPGKDLGLYAGAWNCASTGTTIGGKIVAAGQNIFLQSKDVLPGGFAPSGPHRVFIGEFTTFAPTPSTPKLLVRGGGAFTQNATCPTALNDADNIGLVSQGNFGEPITSGVPNRWLSLGTRPSTTIGFNAYGFRTQWDKYAGDLTMQERALPVGSTVRDVSLTWQDGSNLTNINAAAFNSANNLLIQCRNGQLPSGAAPRLTVAQFSVVAGQARTDLFGTAFVNGAVILTSDSRLKKDVQSMTNAMQIINALKPVTYNYKSDEFPDLGLARGFQYGFIAQDLEKVLPNHVLEGANGYKGVNYIMLIPILTKALQESNAKATIVNDNLNNAEKKIEALDKKLNELSAQNIELNNQLRNAGLTNENNTKNNRAKFYQNIPNPFNDFTSITYDFEDNATYKILVSDLNGKLIKAFTNLNNKGEIKVTKDDLPSAGIYLYSLISESGEIIGSKQMLFEK